jgi:hypothetical protein
MKTKGVTVPSEPKAVWKVIIVRGARGDFLKAVYDTQEEAEAKAEVVRSQMIHYPVKVVFDPEFVQPIVLNEKPASYKNEA